MLASRLILLFLLLPQVAFATPGTFVYQGQITKNDGSPLTGSPTTFLVQILSPTNDCVLYEETHLVSMPANNHGVFSLAVGNGSRTGTSFEDTSVLLNVFNNAVGNMTSLTCTTGSAYNPGATDRRKIRLTYDDGSGPIVVTTDHQVQSVPYAWQAYTLRGLAPTNFVQINAAVNLTQSNLENLLTGSKYANLLALAGGTNTDYVQTGASGAEMPTVTADPGSPVAGAIWYNSTAGQLKFYDGVTTHVLGSSSSVATSVDAATGTAAAPSISFTTEADTGFYNSGANSIGITSAGALIFEFNGTGMQSPTTGGALVRSALGAEATPTYSFSGDDDTGWYSPVADTLVASTAGTERLRITSTGRVGIGSNTPTGILDVQGGAAAAGVAGVPIRLVAQTSGAGSGSAGGLVQINSGVGSGSGAGGAVAISAGSGGTTGNGGAVNISSGNAPGTGTGGAIAITSGNGTGGGANHGGALTLTAGSTSSSGSGTPGVLTLAGGAASAGSSNKTGGTINITAGTGASTGAGGVVNITGGTAGATGVGGTVNIRGGVPIAGAGGNVSIAGANGVGTNQDGGNLLLNAGAATGTGNTGSILMTTGNVGIGTATPQHKLHVEGVFYAPTVVAGALYGGNVTREYGTSGTAGTANQWLRVAHVEMDAQYNAYAFTMDVRSAVASGLAINARITTSIYQVGALGTEPEVSLQLDSANTLLRSSDVVAVKAATATLSTIDLFIRTQNAWQVMYWQPSAGTGWHKSHDHEPVAFVASLPAGTSVASVTGLAHWLPVNTSEVFYSGSVGIGTTDPGTNLHVRYASSGHSPTNVEGIFAETSGSANTFYVLQTASVGGGKSFSVTNAGNVGIATTTPGARLDVSGNNSAVVARFYDQTVGTGNTQVVVRAGAGQTTGTNLFQIQDSSGTPVSFYDISNSSWSAPSFRLANGINGMIASTAYHMRSDSTLQWSSTTNAVSTKDAGISRLAAGVVAIGNGNANNYTGKLVAGAVGIGTTTTPDQLTVAGDIRVGLTGADGCLKDFGGGTITGTCSSDVRLKKNIRSVASISDKLSQLSPKFYNWRTEEFPERGYGDQTELGLIAQDVASILPDMVARDEEGYYKIRYQRLPFYLLKGFSEHHSAIEHLRVENSKLKLENQKLKDRLDVIEKKLGLQ